MHSVLSEVVLTSSMLCSSKRRRGRGSSSTFPELQPSFIRYLIAPTLLYCYHHLKTAPRLTTPEQRTAPGTQKVRIKRNRRPCAHTSPAIRNYYASRTIRFRKAKALSVSMRPRFRLTVLIYSKVRGLDEAPQDLPETWTMGGPVPRSRRYPAFGLLFRYL